MSKTKPTLSAEIEANRAAPDESPDKADKPKAEKPAKRGESPEEIGKLLTQIGATATWPLGILRDIKQNGFVWAGPGEQHTGYVNPDGGVFLMIAGKRIDLEPEDWTEIRVLREELLTRPGGES